MSIAIDVEAIFRSFKNRVEHTSDSLVYPTKELQSYLRNVLGETLALHSFEATLHAGIEAELERRDAIETLKGERFARGEYALTAAEEAHDKEKRKIFNQFLVNRKADLNVWARTFRGHVSTLILKLALHEDAALQTLAFRLDYSDFYKRANSKLHEPLTYQHKRLRRKSDRMIHQSSQWDFACRGLVLSVPGLREYCEMGAI
ncbi:Gamma-tubulin complex component 3 [Eumeta japonica]|uniref:Gamma-tubulin complex component 3 n=1 Tax=Eumeta variegata TaxID=151549 RepID=A0A4C1UYC5_EUMVA|nr:Gamma-tubulin complex component 3 [Eumeta japonica]